MQVVRFLPSHLGVIDLQEHQRDIAHLLNEADYGSGLALSGDAFTVINDGEVVACIGVAEHGPFRAEAWAILSRNVGPHLRFITRAVQGWLQQTSYARVDTLVSAQFKQGHRWARLLGFEQEGPVRPFIFPNGTDGVTYVRFKHGGIGIGGRGPVSGDGADSAGAGPGIGGELQRARDGEPGSDGQ